MSRTPCALMFPAMSEADWPSSGYGEGDERWETLAQVVAENVAGGPGAASVVLRPEGDRRLAILGWFTPEEESEVRVSIDDLIQSLRRVRYVSYAQAEADCAVLAARLQEVLSPEERASATFVGIPRGGLIVLGMLGYQLDLSPEQFGSSGGSGSPLVVVDDCFLTGSRVARFLAENPASEEVVLAGLYAHPDLCSTLQRELPGVRACVHARSLTDYAPALYGTRYSDWRERWDRRATGPSYWRGITDRLCFAWNEPDSGLWNSAMERVSHAWKTMPADRCLKTRIQGADAAPVHVQSPVKGSFTLASEVFFADLTDHVLVAHATLGTVLVLDERAAAFWRALTTHGEIDRAQRALGEIYDVEQEILATDLTTFVDTLLQHRLVESSISVSSAV